MKASIHRFRVMRPAENNGNTESESPAVALQNGPNVSSVATVAACSRCRALKKKCSRTAPTCTLCERAGQKCSLSVPAAPGKAEVQRLEDRVAWLSRVVQEGLLGDRASIDDFETDFNILGALKDAPSALISGTVTSPGRGSQVSGLEQVADWIGDDPEHTCPPHAAQQRGLETESPTGTYSGTMRLPQDAAGRRFVDAYFRNVHRAYPFVDRNQVLQYVTIFENSTQELPEANSRVLYLIMAVGCTSLQRAGQVPEDTTARFDINFASVIGDCMKNEGLASIQMLVLLALYSLFVPDGPATWSIVNLACSQAISSGLAQDGRSTVLSAVEAEQQRRLFWSVYVLDRMTATSMGLPAALPILQAIPLPALTIDEFASEDRPHFAKVLQTNRQVVLLRQIEGQIMQQVHQCGMEHAGSHSRGDLLVAVQDICIAIENWYSSGCLTSPLEEDNVPVHNSVTWLSARYYYLFILLYYPCEVHVWSRLITAEQLMGYVQRHLRSQMALVQQRQLPLNRITLARLLPVGIVIARCSNSVDQSGVPILECVIELITLLESFSERWNLARRGAQIMRDFHNRLKSVERPVSSSSVTDQHPGNIALAELTELIRKDLGRSSCYAAVSMLENR